MIQTIRIITTAAYNAFDRKIEIKQVPVPVSHTQKLTCQSCFLRSQFSSLIVQSFALHMQK